MVDVFKNIMTVWKRETKAYFNSPMAYIMIGLFILVSSILFYFINLLGLDANLEWIFSNFFFGLVLVIFVSVLTMRIYAEDKKNGTEVLLLTSPASLTSIVVGKFLAAFTVFLVMTVATFAYPITLVIFKGTITLQLIGGYVGFILLGGAFVAFGVFASSLTENQIIAAIISFVTLFILLLTDQFSGIFGGTTAKVLNGLSLFARHKDFHMGIFNLSNIVYFLSFVVLFLFLTVRVIEKRRWSQG